MKTFLYYTLFAALLLTGLSGCEKNFLEQDNPTATTDDKWWELESQLKAALNEIYSGLPSGTYAYMPDARMHMAGMTDEAVHGGNFGDWRNYPLGLANSQTGSARDLYAMYYTNIRKACRFLEHYHTAYVENAALKTRYAYEARALRAWYHLQLFLMYGPIPIVDHSLTPNESMAHRNSKEEVIRFIAAELDTCATGLPDQYDNDDAWRIGKGACYAMQSILYINAGDYANAATSAKKVIDMNTYDLHQSNNATNSYADLFSYNGLINKERILFRTRAQVEVFFRNAPKSLGCQAATNPTAAIVNTYETLQGKTIQQLGTDSFRIYQKDPGFKGNRDPRLFASVLLPGDVFVNRKLLPFDRDTQGNPDLIGQPQSTLTGFWMKKYLDPKDAGSTYSGNLNFMIIRYAEVLLNYVEGLIESGQSQNPDVLRYLNKIRQRAGMPVVDAAVYNTPDKLRELVRRERQVELAFEGQRIFDIRRWKLGTAVLNGPVEGAVDPTTGKPVIVEERKFNTEKDYLWPIPLDELNANPNMVQNPNW